jgi:hypothetical protein
LAPRIKADGTTPTGHAGPSNRWDVSSNEEKLADRIGATAFASKNVASLSVYWCILASMGKIRMNIYLTNAQKKALEQLSANTGAPVAELVRRSVDIYLTKRKKELK